MTLTNPGAQELAIDEMRIDGAAASDFTIVSDDCRGRSLARGEKCSVSLVFKPRDAGGREAILKLIGRPADLLPELTLSGVATSTPPPFPPSPGVSPTPEDSTLPSATSPEVQPNPLNFGKVELGRNAVQSVTLTNTGAAQLRIGAHLLTTINSMNSGSNRTVARQRFCRKAINVRSGLSTRHRPAESAERR